MRPLHFTASVFPSSTRSSRRRNSSDPPAHGKTACPWVRDLSHWEFCLSSQNSASSPSPCPWFPWVSFEPLLFLDHTPGTALSEESLGPERLWSKNPIKTSLSLRKINNSNSGKMKFLKKRLNILPWQRGSPEQFFPMPHRRSCWKCPSLECAWREEDGAWKPQLTLCRPQFISKWFLIITLFSMQKCNPITSNYAPMCKAKQIPSFCSRCPPRKWLYSISSRYP